jgi:copper chaperone CopZ
MKQNQNKKITLALSFLLLSLFMVTNAYAANVQRSNFIVSNLSCTSCLATIEAELKGLPGTIGMDADLQKARVTVDHQSELDSEKIGSVITDIGYPAELDWTATVPDQNVIRYQQRSRYSSGCNSGGCSTSGGVGNGSTAWRDAPATGTVSRTTLQVSNLSCTSCLNTIAGELSKLSETYGMKGYLSRGIVIVDHNDTLETSRIAAIISDLGYPARAIASNEVPVQKAFSATSGNRPSSNQIRQSGIGCNSNSPCNATAASWQKLYNRYFTQSNSK